MLEQGTQAPSPAPDLIPAETQNLENSHSVWYKERGHFRTLQADAYAGFNQLYVGASRKWPVGRTFGRKIGAVAH